MVVSRRHPVGVDSGGPTQPVPVSLGSVGASGKVNGVRGELPAIGIDPKAHGRFMVLQSGPKAFASVFKMRTHSS